MARYWINNTGNWNDTSHWSATSGGVSGATVPTSGDTAYFDSNSFTTGSSVTINTTADCYDFIWTGITQNVTLTNSAYNLNVYGDLVLDAKLSTSFTSTGYLYFKSTSAGKTITSNGNASSWNGIYFDGIGGEWTHMDNFSAGATNIIFVNGTWNTNNKTITISYDFASVGSAIRVLNLGSSTINCLKWTVGNPITGITINVGTSKIVATGNYCYFSNLTWYDFESTNSGDFQVRGWSGTFHNFTKTNGNLTFAVGGLYITVNGTLTLNGTNDTTGRMLVYSESLGTQRTITCNGTLSVSNADFRDIKGAGSANWDLSAITGLSGDCGGNSGITFTTAQKQYYKHVRGKDVVTPIENTDFRNGSINNWVLIYNGNGTLTYDATKGAAKLTAGSTGTYSYARWNYTQLRKNTAYKFKFKVFIEAISSGMSSVTLVENGTITEYLLQDLVGLEFGVWHEFEVIHTLQSNATTFRFDVRFNSFNSSNNNVLYIDDVTIEELESVLFSEQLNWFSNSDLSIAGRVPLPQDDWDAIAGSFNANDTFILDCPRIGRSLDMSGVNQAVTMSLANAIECYGSFVLGDNITTNGNYEVYLCGRSVFDIKTYNKILYRLYIYAFNGTYINRSDLTVTNTIRPYYGTFDLNDFNSTSFDVICGAVNGILGQSVYLRSGLITVTCNSIYSCFSYPTNLYCGTSTIKMLPTSGSSNPIFYGGNKTYNKVWFSGSHTGNFDITGSNNIAEFVVDPGRKVRFTASSAQNINHLTAIGTADSGITIGSTVTGSTFTLSKAGGGYVQCDYINIRDSIASPTNTFYAGKNSINSGNNTNWIFGNYAKTPQIMIMKC